MKPSIVRQKSYQFAIDVVKFCRASKDGSVRPLMMQLLRSGTAIAANIEEATGGQSRKDFVAKMCIASKEAREANFWLRLLRDSGAIREPDIRDLISLSTELVRILTSIIKTTKENDAALSLRAVPSNSKFKTQNSKLHLQEMP